MKPKTRSGKKQKASPRNPAVVPALITGRSAIIAAMIGGCAIVTAALINRAHTPVLADVRTRQGEATISSGSYSEYSTHIHLYPAQLLASAGASNELWYTGGLDHRYDGGDASGFDWGLKGSDEPTLPSSSSAGFDLGGPADWGYVWDEVAPEARKVN